MALIEVKNLGKVYHNEEVSTSALENISFDIEQGEFVAITGPSGSGKSTLARVLMGVWPDVAGDVLLCGVPLASWDRGELGPHLGYLPQDIELFEGTLAENIARLETRRLPKLGDVSCIADDTVTDGRGAGSMGCESCSESRVGGEAPAPASAAGGSDGPAPEILGRRRRLMAGSRKLGVAFLTAERRGWTRTAAVNEQ